MLPHNFVGYVHTLFQVSSAWSLYKVLRAIGFLTITCDNTPIIERNQNYLFVSNHQSYLDVYAIFMGLKTRIIYRSCPLRFMTASSVYFSPLLPFIWLGGGFPTRRKDKTYHAVNYAIERLDLGERVVIFPEGRRSVPGTVQPHSGVTRIINGVTKPLNIILVRLHWRRTSWFRRSLHVTYKNYSGRSDQDSLMQTIYSL